jgi:hypothetical protein
MDVDVTDEGLRATTARGAQMLGVFGDSDSATEAWRMEVPRRIVDEGWWPEIEDLVSLVLTTGWRRAAWVPLHAAGLVKDGRGVLVCASSRGGKTTFSLAMAQRGWQLVGDDKLLVGKHDGEVVVAAVKHTLNVDPAAGKWFTEVGDLTGLPIYSEWSPKRRVRLSRLFPEAAASVMLPTHVVALSRVAADAQLTVTPMEGADTIATLLRQTVIPTEPNVARFITRTVASLATNVRGLRVALPDDVYSDPSALDSVERALL